jgi:hypothetical protein
MTFHEVKRTSKAGDGFVGECAVCGAQGITLDALQTEPCTGVNPFVAACQDAYRKVVEAAPVTSPPLSPQIQAAVARAKADPRSSRNSWKGYRW